VKGRLVPGPPSCRASGGSWSRPAGTEAVTSGRREESRTKGGHDLSLDGGRPVGGLALAAGPYRLPVAPWGGHLFTFLSPANAGLAERYLVKSAEYLELYRNSSTPILREIRCGGELPSHRLRLPLLHAAGGSVIRLPFISIPASPRDCPQTVGNGVLVADPGGNWSEGWPPTRPITFWRSVSCRGRLPSTGARSWPTTRPGAAGEGLPATEFSRRADPLPGPSATAKGPWSSIWCGGRSGPGFFAALRAVARDRLFRKLPGAISAGVLRAGSRTWRPLLEPWLTQPEGRSWPLRGCSCSGTGPAGRSAGRSSRPVPSTGSACRSGWRQWRRRERDIPCGTRTPFSLAVPVRPRRCSSIRMPRFSGSWLPERFRDGEPLKGSLPCWRSAPSIAGLTMPPSPPPGSLGHAEAPW